MDSEYVCSVQKENKLGFYRIHTIWSTEGVQVKIASKDASWFGQVSQQKLEETSKNLNQLPDKYLEECKAALTTDEGMPGLVYAVEDGSFVWKKTIDEELGIKVQLGSIPLEPISFVDTIQKMLDVALLSKQKLKNNLVQSKLDKETSDNNVTEMYQRLNECESKIINMENDLMRNFVLLLNAKKCKISELKQENLMLRASRPKKLNKKKGKAVNQNSYDMDTDEDMPGSPTLEHSLGGFPPHSNDPVTPQGEIELAGTIADKNVLPCNSENKTDTCDFNKEKTPETLPSKSADILGFFFGAV